MNRLLLLLATLLLTGAASAADITVLSSTGLTSTLDKLKQTFETRSGDRLVIRYATAGQLKTRIDQGEAFDLCILTAPLLDDLIKSGKASAPRFDIARSGIGVSIRKGAAKPDISTPENFKRTILAAQSLAYTSTGSSGTYFLSLADRLGIGDAVRAKSHTTPAGPAGELVARGEAELAIQQIAELLPVAGTELVGPLPPELQSITLFAAGIGSAARNPAGARALADFLASPDAIAVIRVKGMQPGL
jgi:molybdate transport system substrate-binding protein